MTPPPSREPGQAGVTDAEAKTWQDWAEEDIDGVEGSDGVEGNHDEMFLRLLADRTRYQERIRALEQALKHWGGDGRHMGISKVDPVTCPSCVKARALLEVPDEDHN